MELIVFGVIAIAVVYVLYRAYGPKNSAPSVAEVVAAAEEVVEAKPAKKKAAAKKPTVKKATTRKTKAK